MSSIPTTQVANNSQLKSTRLLSPRSLFIVASVFGLLSQALFPTVRQAFGVFDLGMWFSDSHAMLASSDAAHAGIGSSTGNSNDHSSERYSASSSLLSAAGLSREDNFLVGSIIVLAFLVAVFATLRPRSYAEAVWLALLVASPPVFLGIIRANSDLLSFVFLAAALVALRESSSVRIGLAVVALALATGLKLYPMVAAGVLLLIPNPRHRNSAMTLGLFVLLLVAGTVWSQVARGTFIIGPGIHTFGSRILFLDFGLSPGTAALVSAFLFVLLAAVLTCLHRVPEPQTPIIKDDAQMAFAMGAALLVTCFIAGTNYGYRFMFALWVAPWCWVHRTNISIARFGIWLLPIVLWKDGILCLATTFGLPNLRPEQYERIFIGWRIMTEPLTWYLMALLAAWWLRFGLILNRELDRKP